MIICRKLLGFDLHAFALGCGVGVIGQSTRPIVLTYVPGLLPVSGSPGSHHYIDENGFREEKPMPIVRNLLP